MDHHGSPRVIITVLADSHLPSLNLPRLTNASLSTLAYHCRSSPSCVQKAWEVATAPAKALPMNAFMMYMSGSGVQIFSIMITAMMLYQPVKAILGVQTGMWWGLDLLISMDLP